MKTIRKAAKSILQRIGLQVSVAPFKSKSTYPLREEFRFLRHGGLCLQKLIDDYKFDTVLDIGSGDGQHSALFVKHGKKLTAVDYGSSVQFAQKLPAVPVIVGDFMKLEFDKAFDCVWASHVLEHSGNPQAFLSKVVSLAKEGGVIAITVPPLKHQIVGGHLSLWNIGMLLYHLIASGIDCSTAQGVEYDYNISVLVRKKTISLPALSSGPGDLELLKAYFPAGIKWNVHQGKSFGAQSSFDGDIKDLSWSVRILA